jgi:hypothetical protein
MNKTVGSDVGNADNYLDTAIDYMGANVAKNVKSKTTLPYIELLS